MQHLIRYVQQDQLTFGDFLSVSLLTRTGLSYLTSEEFGRNHCVAADKKNLHENCPFCAYRFERLMKLVPKLSLPWKQTTLKRSA